MARIGKLNIKTNEAGRLFAKGSFRTITVGLNIQLIPYSGDVAEKHPTHVVFAMFGEENVEVGAAWMKPIGRGENEGKPMFSFTVDDPSLDAPLNLTAFPAQEQDVYEIVWRRQRGGGGIPTLQEAQEAIRSGPAYQGNGEDLDDEIPF